MIDSATITGVIDRLEEAGLLERQADDGDRRVHRLFLTAPGQDLKEPLDAAMDQLNAEARVELKGKAREPCGRGPQVHRSILWMPAVSINEGGSR